MSAMALFDAGRPAWAHGLKMDCVDLKRFVRMSHRERVFTPGNQAIVREQSRRMQHIQDTLTRQYGICFPGPDPVSMEGVLCSFMSEAGELGIEEQLPRELLPARDFSLCNLVSHRCGNPLWVLDEELGQTLLATSPPDEALTPEVFNTRLRLPYPAFYLQTGPLFDLHDDRQNTDHPLEGIYLCDTWTFERGYEAAYLEARTSAEKMALVREHGFERVLVVVAVGKAIGLTESHSLDDCVITIRLHSTSKLDEVRQGDQYQRVFSLTSSFLHALNGGYLATQAVKAKPTPKNPRKAHKQALRGEIHEAYTRVSLSAQARKQRAERQSRDGAAAGSVRPHWVRGHWHAYWRKDPERYVVTATEGEGDARKHRCLLWLMPYLTGAGSPDAQNAPRYKVTR